mgnify:CR=1 FL=1
MGNQFSIEEVFSAARALTDPVERAAYLDAACGDDADLRAKVEGLLRAEAEAGSFLESADAMPIDPNATLPQVEAPSSSARTVRTAAAEQPGALIGPYKLLQLIGEGGFGSVFMAEQEQPVRRKVALKIIKLGMDTRQVVARFEQERQALALMDHPNIARVLDAGATETGRPFFVMELVKGDPIVEYCDKNNLSIQERLELFAQVCTAVQHAHTKGIIHRDIKPNNVLVSTQDGRPNTKVIDFGIAKATSARLTEKTLFTEHRQLIGTPEYMSPEQAEGSLDIDTRTDVYSLGVLLYELLTGTTPFNSKELRSAAYAEIQRIIREVEPPKPSTRLSQHSDTLASVAARRHIEPKKLGTVIRGELDWIVMKCLEKDRQRRYETANGLATDIRRYLAGEAVVAAPPSTAYRFKKFIRRHRMIVTTSGAVAATLLIGVAAFAWQAREASNQRDLAVAAREAEAEQRKVADAARMESQMQEARAKEQEAEAIRQAAEAKEQEAEARKQAAIAEAVVAFQTDMLAAVNPVNLPKDPETNEPLKDQVTVLQVMKAAVRELDKGSLKDQPLVEARVRVAIGVTLLGLARYDEAEPNLRRALEISLAALPDGHLNIATVLYDLAWLLQKQNKSAEAEPLYRRSLEIRRASLPVGHPKLATSLSALAGLLVHQNRLVEAEPLQREAVEIFRAAHPAGHPDTATALNNFALLMQRQNKLAEAEQFQREALQIYRATLPNGHPDIAICLNNLVDLLRVQNRSAEAEPLSREALQIYRAVLPAGHPDIAGGLDNLAQLLRDQHRLDQAEPLYREALQINRAALPAGHPDIANGLNNLASLYWSQGRLDQSVPMFEEALDSREASNGRQHLLTLVTVANLGVNYKDAGRLSEAIPLLEEAYEASKVSPSLGWVGMQLLDAYQRAADPARPESMARVTTLLQEVLVAIRATLPPDSPELAWRLGLLGKSLLEMKAWNAAEPLVREALTILENTRPDDWQTFYIKSVMGATLLGQNKLAQAEPLLLDGCEGMVLREASIPQQAGTRMTEAIERLVRHFEAEGNAQRAAEWRAKLDARQASTSKNVDADDSGD